MFHTLDDGITMYYEMHGNEHAQNTIVLLNGLSQSTIAWTAVLPGLTKKHRVLLLDLVFQGQSGPAPTPRSYDDHADDVMSLLRHLHITKAVIAGLSYGGAVAQHFAVRYPDVCSRLILISTFAHKTAHFNAIGDSWVSALKAGGYPLMLDIMLPIVLGADYFENPLIPIETLKTMRVSAQPSSENLLMLMHATEQREDYREKLGTLDISTLIIHGEKDLLIPVSDAMEIKGAIKNSSMNVIRNTGHTLNLEAIPELARMISAYSELV